MAKGSCPTRELTVHVFPSVALEQPARAIRDFRGCLGARGGGRRETSLAMEPGLLPDHVQDYRLITACQAGPQTQGRTVSLGGSQT